MHRDVRRTEPRQREPAQPEEAGIAGKQYAHPVAAPPTIIDQIKRCAKVSLESDSLGCAFKRSKVPRGAHQHRRLGEHLCRRAAVALAAMDTNQSHGRVFTHERAPCHPRSRP